MRNTGVRPADGTHTPEPRHQWCRDGPSGGVLFTWPTHRMVNKRLIVVLSYLILGIVLKQHFTFTFHFHALEKEMATHSSVLAWRIPGTGEPGGLPSMGSYRVGHG